MMDRMRAGIFCFMIAYLIIGCSAKRHSPAYERYLVDKKKIETVKAAEKRAAQKDLKEIFPEAGTCPIDISKIDPDSPQGKLDMALELCNLSQDLWEEGDSDEAIKLLDDAYGLILAIDNDKDDPSIEQQKDDLRFLISKRILEIYTSRLRTTKGLNTPIPLTMNKYVQKEIDLFTGKERRFFLESYKRSGKYRPMILRELKKAGLPEELSWLPLIESGFKVRALSPARALGLWQFIPSTGYKYGLKRTVWIDERLDPEKSTRAAIAYLTELHEIFGDWSTVLAAYNCGERTVLKAIDKQKINYLDNFWDLYERLPRETARYVPRFIATLLIIKNPEKYGMILEKPDDPIPFETITVNKQMSLDEIAKAIGVNSKILKDLNPSLRYGVTPKAAFALRVPKGYAQILLAKIDKIKKWVPPRRSSSYRYAKGRVIKHRVRRGETLSGLARRYHSSVKAIKRANRLRSSRIRTGQLLKIPTGRHFKAVRSGKKSGRRTYVVKKGDTLWDIARRFNVSITRLKRRNRLSSNCLAIGQVLVIPSN